MVYKGHIKNGMVVLDSPPNLTDGTEVEVAVIQNNRETGDETVPPLSEQFKDFIGIFDDLPPDFAENHDHYIHGAPKK